MNAIIPEPIHFVQHHDAWHVLGDLPLKTVFDVQNLAHHWIKVDEARSVVEFTIDGRSVIYERVATGAHGEWICELRRGEHGI